MLWRRDLKQPTGNCQNRVTSRNTLAARCRIRLTRPSVCMPLWQHNVAYEEGDQSVISAFNSGYPRFFMNPLVTELRTKLAERLGVMSDESLLLPTEGAARRCAAYVQHRTGSSADIHATDEGVWLIQSPAGKSALREFWQHSGEIVASRTAQRCLVGDTQSITATDPKQALREHVAELQHVPTDDVYLFPSGMAAIYTAWRITQSDTAAPIQFGFPYVDTFKILERFGNRRALVLSEGLCCRHR